MACASSLQAGFSINILDDIDVWLFVQCTMTVTEPNRIISVIALIELNKAIDIHHDEVDHCTCIVKVTSCATCDGGCWKGNKSRECSDVI